MSAFLRPPAIALLSLCGLLSITFVRQLFGPEKGYVIPTVSLSLALPQVPQLPVFDPPPTEVLLEISERPLFNPKREPIQPAIENKEVPPPAPQVAFIGTISQAGQQIAMVKTPSSPLAFSVRVGGTLEGWQVSDISQERILLAAKSATYEVKLNQGPPRPQPGSANNPRLARAARGRPDTPPTAPPPNTRARFRGVQVP